MLTFLVHLAFSILLTKFLAEIDRHRILVSFEVFARRVGSELDSHLRILDAKGEVKYAGDPKLDAIATQEGTCRRPSSKFKKVFELLTSDSLISKMKIHHDLTHRCAKAKSSQRAQDSKTENRGRPIPSLRLPKFYWQKHRMFFLEPFDQSRP
jgi:hypothetical protein